MLSTLTDRQWLGLAAGLYFAVTAWGTVSVVRGRPHSSAVAYLLMLAGYALQLAGLYLRGRAVGGCPLGNAFEILQFTAWSATTLYLVVGVTFRSSLLGYFTALLTAVLSIISLLVPAWDASRRSNVFGGNAWIEFHAALALFSYGVFALLALTSLMFLLRNYSLKAKRIGGWFNFLPSILDLDHISVRLLVTGVSLLAASLAVGAVWWIRDTATANGLKIAITVGVWVAYSGVLGLRTSRRLLSTRFAWACVILFGAALVSLGPVDASRHPAPAVKEAPAGK